MQKNKQVFSKTRYQVIPRVLVFAFNNNQVLLLKGAPSKKIWANLYNGIGGHIELGEHPLSAARREFEEESGLQLLSPELKAIVFIDTQDKNVGISMHVFSGIASPGKIKSSKEGIPEWVSLKSYLSLPLVEDLHWLIPKISSNEISNFPIFAQYSYNESNNLLIDFE